MMGTIIYSHTLKLISVTSIQNEEILLNGSACFKVDIPRIIPYLAFMAILSCGEDNPVVEEEESRFRLPLDTYTIIQDFAHRSSAFSNKYHSAEDLIGDAGTEVYAIADGVISYSASAVGYGWLITINHEAEGVYSLYGHLSTRRTKVNSGAVLKGEIIASLADDDEDGSGGVYPDWGPHLHFSIREGVIFDYPGFGDSRWSAGYTEAHPESLGWLKPSDFFEEN